MRSLVYVSPGRVEWEEFPEPGPPGPGAAVVAPLAVARCDLDLPMATRGLFPGPFPVGHEIAATVVAVGDGVGRHRPGDTVIVPYQLSCGECPPCRRGTFAACRTHMAPLGGSFGFGPSGGGHGGGLTDLMAVPHADHLLLTAPPDLSPSVAATLSDNVVDGYRAVGPPLALRPGAEVLVVAATPGSVALYATAAALALGAATVHHVDRDPQRVQAAAALGAQATLHEGPWPRRLAPAPITVDATGDSDGLACVLRSTERYRTCTSVSIAFEPTTPVPLLEMYTRGVTLHTSRADSRRYLPDVLRLLAGSSFDPMGVPTTTCTFDEVATAWLEPAVKLVALR